MPRPNTASWCQECRDSVQMLAPEHASKLSNVSTRTIYRWVEDGSLHFRETEDAGLLICFASLFAGLDWHEARIGESPASD